MSVENEEMSFIQFQASRERVANLADVLPEAIGYEGANPGYVYKDGLYIEETSSSTLSLLIYRHEYIALPERAYMLEAILYQWALGELFWIDNTAEQSTAKAAAEAIFKLTTIEQASDAMTRALVEPMPGVCRLQDVADVWPILDSHATSPDVDLDVAYELLRGLVAYRRP